MSKYCADCEYIDTTNKKCDGIYKCKQSKCYISSCNRCCDKFIETYMRSGYEKQKLYDLGKISNQDDTSITFYVILLVMFCIIGFLGKIMGY